MYNINEAIKLVGMLVSTAGNSSVNEYLIDVDLMFSVEDEEKAVEEIEAATENIKELKVQLIEITNGEICGNFLNEVVSLSRVIEKNRYIIETELYLNEEEHNELNEMLEAYVNTLNMCYDVVKGEAEYRVCTNCGEVMFDGFIVEDGREYYCSGNCLHKHYSEEEYEEMYQEDIAYYTEWY